MEATNVGLKKVSLRQLEPDLTNALIVAIIIAKQRPRRFANARNNEDKDRAVWNFTVRDSPQNYINVTFWGVGDDIFKLNDSFQVGDIVEIIRPKITVRQAGDYGDQFRPMVTSPYTLTMNDNVSELLGHEGNSHNNFKRLLHFPTKPMAGFVTLSDIQSGGSNKVGEFVDILVAVRSIGMIRNVKTREGIEQQVRDFMVFDHTSPGVRISTWDQEFMTRIAFWKPRSTILFMTDMKIDFSQFHNSLMPMISSRTIITQDPEGPEADTMRNYAQTAALEPVELLDQMACTILDPNSIQNVMSAQQVLDKICSMSGKILGRTQDRSFSALLYVIVTQMDLDGLSRVMSTRCTRCKRLIQKSADTCENPDCAVAMGSEALDSETRFDIRLNLGDHTGILTNCRLTGQVAETVLNCTVDEFSEMSNEEKCSLKWRYLMERCAVRIMVLSVWMKNPLITVLSCSLASPSEVANKLPHY